VWLHQGLVSEVFPVPGPPQGLLLPRLVDLHVHLDKSYTVAEAGPADGDLFAAIERMARHRVASLTRYLETIQAP
jgi:cytosine deaminase